jgi:hypothetical protein
VPRRSKVRRVRAGEVLRQRESGAEGPATVDCPASDRRSASKPYSRFRASPRVDERVFVARALTDTFSRGCGSR